MTSINTRIEKIEEKIGSTTRIHENSETRWAFDLARRKIEPQTDPVHANVRHIFQQLVDCAEEKDRPEQAETARKMRDSTDVNKPNPRYDPDPVRREAAICEMASNLIRRYGSLEEYKTAQQRDCPVNKYFRQLMEADEQQRARGEAVY